MTERVNIPTLETDRLILRAYRPSDFDALAEMLADPQAMRFLFGPRNRHEAWRTMSGMAGQWVLNGYGFFAVEEKASGQFVGHAGPNHPQGWPGLELGWSLARQYWGKGYATEAAIAAGSWIFTLKPDLPRLISMIDARNLASQKVAKRLGQTHNGEQFDHWTAGPEDIWAISRADWFARHG